MFVASFYLPPGSFLRRVGVGFRDSGLRESTGFQSFPERGLNN